MTLSTQHMRACLQTFDFKRLFVEELGWNTYSARIAPAEIDGVRCTFTPIAEQGGMVVVTCTAEDGNIPPSGARRKIDQHVTDLAFEHLIIFVDRDSKGTAQTSLWWWVKRDPLTPNPSPTQAGRGEKYTSKPRTFTYRRGMMGDALLQKLAGIAFAIEDLDAEGHASIATVTSRVKKAFDVETVTKKFYDQFKTEHTAFLKFLTGLPDGQPKDWYASVMLNRLMFLYFIQKKRFLNDDPDYLRTKLEAVRGAGQNFYRDFLVILFFDGLACEDGERDDATNRLLGKIPYLNGGLFLPHALEDQYGAASPDAQIAIADEAFERLFNFFDGYTWHLDERPLRQGNEINPDVLGYIFEKYINQKQMGAYYTKEDITGYICRSTILPFLLDKVGVTVKDLIPPRPEGEGIDPYIYDAVATEEYLPTETEREYAARRARYAQIKADFAAGKITTVDDLVTYNLDIQTLVEDWLRGLSDPVLLRRFYFECLLKLTVLDPTAGSGAFLFAAINILEPLYELALDKMQQIVGEPPSSPDPFSLMEKGSQVPRPEGEGFRVRATNVVKYLDFVDELKRVSAHPNRRYFVLKSIIVNNLYGVDIMDEATEICKLRLFLKMVAQVDSPAQIEPLPDIDFNIRAGNTLVGFATRGEIEGRLFATEALKRKVEDADRALRNFRDLLTRTGVESKVFKAAKKQIREQMDAIRADLDASLMDDYGLTDLDAFRASHKPFHWYVEFNSVLANGGFDVIVGNPPYVESNKVKEYEIRNYESEPSHNLYAYTMERAVYIQRQQGRFSVIVPVGAFSVNETVSLRALLNRTFSVAWLSGYGIRPSKLFDGVDQRLSIYIGVKQSSNESKVYSSKYHHWYSEEREHLFERLTYQDVSRLGANGVFPKAGDSLATGIIEKVRRQAKPIGAYLLRSNGFKMHYHRSPRYWIRAMDFEQHFRSATRTRSIHHFRDLYAIDAEMGKFVGAALNSSLFFFWFLTVGNGRNLTGDDVKDFFVGTPTPDVVKEMGEIFDRLMIDYRNNSVIRVRKDQEYQEFDQSASKPIIDEIDRVLARHYDFTEAELDFIIHYDIKYRMGRDAESDGDEGEE